MAAQHAVDTTPRIRARSLADSFGGSDAGGRVRADSSEPSLRAGAFVRWSLRHGRVLWIVALILAVPAVWRAVSLYAHLRSELDQLLPRNAPSVVAIQELRTRMQGLQYLGVVVDAGDAKNLPAAEKLVDDLAARVRAYPPELVRAVRTSLTEERDFIKAHAALYADLPDLETVRRRLEARKEYEAARAFGAALDDSETPPPLELSDLEKKYRARDETSDRFPNGRLSSVAQHTTLMLVEVGSYSTGTDTGHELLDRARSDVQALGGLDHYAPGMRVGFTGDVAISVEELSALVSDLTVSSIIVLLAVAGVILAYYRWWRSLPALVAPLLLATVYSFAIVTLPPFRITELNSNTAFLGSIIVGNGINFGIILLARYVEERRRGADVERAILVGVWGSRIGTLSAALAAAVAYVSLTVTQFRGFRQFGVIGGIGMVLCWVTAYVLTPSLLKWLDRGPSSAPAPVPVRPRLPGRIANAVSARPGVFVAVAAALLVLSVVRLRHVDRSVLEYDLGRLRRADSYVSGEGYWGRKMDVLLGRYLTPVVMLTDGPAKTRAVAAAVREAIRRPPLVDMIASVQTIDDVLPADQPAKIAEAEAIRALMTPKIRSEIDPEKLRQIDDLLGPSPITPVGERDLPSALVAGFRERDGTVDHAVLVYPRPSHLLWEGEAILALTRDLRELAAAGGGASARVAGSVPLSADIISTIEKDGALATVTALGGVVGLVLLVFRRGKSTWLVIGSLLLAVVYLGAATMFLHVKINFANFIAFPITFGIGVDYAVNIVARYREDGGRDLVGAIRSTGGAVALCSMTTIIGYSSLLLAANRALFSFGLLAVLGEICCLTTAVLVLPAGLLAWRRLRAGSPATTSTYPEVVIRTPEDAQSQPSARAPSNSRAPHTPATMSSSTTPQPPRSDSARPAGQGLS